MTDVKHWWTPRAKKEWRSMAVCGTKIYIWDKIQMALSIQQNANRVAVGIMVTMVAALLLMAPGGPPASASSPTMTAQVKRSPDDLTTYKVDQALDLAGKAATRMDRFESSLNQMLVNQSVLDAKINYALAVLGGLATLMLGYLSSKLPTIFKR